MSDSDRDPGLPPGDVEDLPVISCSRCNQEWELDYELEELHAGNRALEQFALDHQRHTGHYPDDTSPWLATCRHCPAGEAFLAERPARRWAETHARHARHDVGLDHADGEEGTEAIVEPDSE